MEISCDLPFMTWHEPYNFPVEEDTLKEFTKTIEAKELPYCWPEIDIEKFFKRYPIIPGYIKPEVMGCTVGGIISLVLAVLAFVSGQIGAGLVLLGPFFASILGCSTLIALSKRWDYSSQK